MVKQKEKEKTAGGIPTPWMTPVSSLQPAVITSTVPPAPTGSSIPTMQGFPQMNAMQMPSNGGTLDSFSILLQTMSSNPYLIGILMLLLNLGGRFLSMELTKKQEEFLQQRWLRPLIFFTVIFVATRNLAVAFWITLLFFLIIWVVANEKSPFCMIPGWIDVEQDKKQSNYEENMNKIEQYSQGNIL